MTKPNLNQPTTPATVESLADAAFSSIVAYVDTEYAYHRLTDRQQEAIHHFVGVGRRKIVDLKERERAAADAARAGIDTNANTAPRDPALDTNAAEPVVPTPPK